jgi:hydroxypyruvate reductase
MAIALEGVLGTQLLTDKHVAGWINVPANCVAAARRITLHAARPAGVNEPCAEGVEGTRRILEMVSSLGPRDLCFCLLSGGGSALLPAPVPEISLADKVRLIQLISAAGGNIEDLNIVRSQLSLVKGGGLAKACRAGRLVTLVISDVLGDRLDIIASGPTTSSNAAATDALQVLTKLGLLHEPRIANVLRYLHLKAAEPATLRPRSNTTVEHSLILANNAAAVDAAGVEAEKLGYSHAMIAASASEGAAEDVGRHLARLAIRMRDEPGPDCLISGGEPTVTLAAEGVRGKGGRNQQLALAALSELGDSRDVAFLSAGTDGEDGPTDAAGAVVTPQVIEAARVAGLDPKSYLARNDAYNFFLQTGGLFVTGPTHTNVCDLRVIAVNQACSD